jgi:D-beta-D-heptose 7-phosphate kinase/D-beta-D-heptose 1-phosphate adenosyltransferase
MTTNLSNLLDQFANHRVMVVGDLMLDRFIYGTVDRISPEAPIPVLRIQRETIALGGAGNVVRNLSSLGAQVDVIGVAGQDSASFDMAQLFAELPNVASMVLPDAARPTTLKVRCIGGSQQLIRADRETTTAISPEMEQQILQRVQAALPSVQVLILSDYAKGVLTEKLVPQIIALAKAQNKPVLIDPKGRDFSRYRGATMLTPNRKELTEATGAGSIKTVAEAEQAARSLIAKYDVNVVLAKLGGDGVCLVAKDEPALHIHGMAKEVYDVSGAGDTVVATMALALAAGGTLADAAHLANLAGSIVVGKVGTATISVDDLHHGLHDDDRKTHESKIMTWQEAFEQTEKWRLQGLKVGFTNGCFDLIHPGHLSLLRQTRSRCDRLIVGLNTDASVRRLKGDTRPVQNELSRATVLSAMADVDGVVLFDQETPLELIRTLRPHLLVKGADYTPDKVVGWDLVQGWGGELYLANLVQGQSTTSTIARMKLGETPKIAKAQ